VVEKYKEESLMSKSATLYDLCKALFSICCRHPELKDKIVTIHTECGYSGAGIPYPIKVYTHSNLEGVNILTDDDNAVDTYPEDFTIYD
jgi:hypothetical protein